MDHGLASADGNTYANAAPPLPARKGAPYWLSLLADEGSFEALPDSAWQGAGAAVGGRGDEIIAGFAKIHGRPVAVYVHDTQVNVGFISSHGSKKIVALMNRALDQKIPLVALLASPGIALNEGLKAGDDYTKVIMAHNRCSGHIPQIAMIMGAVMGGASYSALLMDFIIFSQKRSFMMVSGPGVVEVAVGEKTTFEKLGGANHHAAITGMAHFVMPSVIEQFACLKSILDYLPSNGFTLPRAIEAKPPRDPLPQLPFEVTVAFDMEKFLRGVVDESLLLHYSPSFGKSMITSFGRLDGRSVGIVANQSRYHSGAITADAAQKTARFIRLCDAYNIPIITFIDVPGYMIGSTEEQKGIVRQGAAMVQAVMKTRVPKFSVIVRRCYGAAAFVMMQTAAQNGDLVLALDQSRVAIMGFHAAKDIVYPGQYTPESAQTLKQNYFEQYEQPAVAKKIGIIDDVVSPDELRDRLITALNKSKYRDFARSFPLEIQP